MENAVLSGDVDRLIGGALAVMRATGDLDPKVTDIVAAAGSSLKSFYKHFPSKDDLLLAILDDGQRQLVRFLERQIAGRTGDAAVAAWVKGILAQARHPHAAAATRPFVRHRARLASAFPDATAASLAALTAPLRAALRPISADPRRDAAAIAQLAIGTMEHHLLVGSRPRPADVAHLVHFALGGITRGT